MNLEDRFKAIKQLLAELIPLISADDQKTIQGQKISHPWISKAKIFTPEEKLQFEAYRNFQTLQDSSWIETIQSIKRLTTYPSINDSTSELKLIGNLKKQHEFKQLYEVLKTYKHDAICDFGGGVGKLAQFMHDNLNADVTILEKDASLIQTGKEKCSKKDIHYIHTEINKTKSRLTPLQESDICIGLHTCGNFATNMMDLCIYNQVKMIMNIGCCYSKIQDHEYHHSSLANKDLVFNQRALAAATLGYAKTSKEIYEYRIKIMNYKNALHLWLYLNHNHKSFLPMSNARRTLYSKDFPDFVRQNYSRFFPTEELPDKDILFSFYMSEEVKDLNDYFQAYYSIARYIGELLESYILCDRALYLQEQGHDVSIIEVFNKTISPRNKAIIAQRTS